jgi:hypothetical protein
MAILRLNRSRSIGMDHDLAYVGIREQDEEVASILSTVVYPKGFPLRKIQALNR